MTGAHIRLHNALRGRARYLPHEDRTDYDEIDPPVIAKTHPLVAILALSVALILLFVSLA